MFGTTVQEAPCSVYIIYYMLYGTYIHTYSIYICVCVCVCVSVLFSAWTDKTLLNYLFFFHTDGVSLSLHLSLSLSISLSLSLTFSLSLSDLLPLSIPLYPSFSLCPLSLPPPSLSICSLSL